MVPGGVRTWTVWSPTGPVDVDVDAPDDAALAAVAPALAAALGRTADDLWSGSDQLPGSTPLTAPALGHGARLGLGRPGPRESGPAASALEVHVTGGPEAGRALGLSRGRLVVGRGAACGLSLDDADVSRRHAVLEVGDGAITVADLGSANGSRLGSEVLGPEPRPWPPGVPLQVGASTLHLAGTAGGALPSRAVHGGRTVLAPQHRLTAPRIPVDVPFPAEPGQPVRRRLGWVAVALPAVGGVAMAWVLSAPHFLFFALLSPLVALATWGSDRWSGRRGSRREAAEHALENGAAHARLIAAVAADGTAARAAAPDAATLAAAARRRSEPLWQRRRADPDALVVRVGTGPASTRVSRLDADGRRSPVTAPDLPVTVDLRSTGVLGLVGPRPLVQAVAATLLVQLTGLHPPGDVRLALLTRPEDVGSWVWARWLPHLSPQAVHCDPAGDEELHRELDRWVAAQRAGGGPAVAGWLVVVVDRALSPATAALLADAAPAGVLGVCLGATVHELPVPAGAVITVHGETGTSAALSRRDAQVQDVTTLDLVPAATAALFARRLAPLTVPRGAAELPVAVRLTDLVGSPSAPVGAGPVRWSRTRTRLGAAIGRSATGVVEVDLCAQGPHALVAGTTGSGKSELLQTLVAGLAANHPPDRCTFLLVDYKGGAAFAEAALLPHTVGLVTDLDPQTTTRALRSLGAELARREQLLADHDVRDLTALPEAVPLARLVIVVDEFATLAEELPGFVSGLVGIAQRGRSLGVHLVLATQRPAGVVSPEIRANCTLRICLRTTDEADSRDVLGTPVAAHLPVELPGRAHLRCGTDSPTLFQVARVSTSAVAPVVTAPRVRRRGWPAPPDSPPSARTGDGETDLAALVTSLGAAAAQQHIAPPHRPWRPPLPDRLTAADLAERTGPADGSARGVLRLGLVDRPDQQAQEVLTLDLADGGTWLAVGGPRSGRTGLLQTVLATATGALPPSELQVHVLDHGGGALAAEAGALLHAGTTVGRDDALRAVRLVRRLEEEVARRRALGADAAPTHLVLLVDGLESVCALLDESDPALGAAALLRLARDGTAVGLTCVCTADRAVPGGRLAAVATRRLVLPLPDRADYAVAGVPARAVPVHLPPGRALVGADGLECQLVLPPQELHPAADPVGARPATGVRIPPLPAQAWLPRSPEPGHDGDAALPPALWLPVGPGGDDGAVMGVDLRRSGGLLVAGPGGSGRTTALTAFVGHWHAAGVPVLRIDPAAGPITAPGSSAVQDWADALGEGPGVIVVDDLIALPDPVADLLTVLCRPGRSLVLVGAGAPAELAATFRGPAMALRRARTGLLLRPGPGDADVLGIRLPRTPVADRPGSGWLVLAGIAQRVQVARRR
jgi:S-DNA-T family DNA segregation ATPase FtsK/SpoIIIE